MRILFISNFYPPHGLGGMELRCQETANHLRARTHTCHVLTSHYSMGERSQPEEDVTRTLHLQADIDYYRPLDFFLRRPKQEQANLDALRQALDDFQPDIVFIWGLWNLSLSIAYWAEQWMPGRVAYSVAGYWFMLPDVHESYWQKPARRIWVRAFMAPARWLALHTLSRTRKTHPLALEHITCVSEYVRHKLSEAGALPDGARVIYNGIAPQPFLQAAAQRTPGPNLLRLVYTGSLVTHKGVHTAIEALGLLQNQGEADGLHLDVVGGGHPSYETFLKQRVEELGLSNCVTFRGRVPRSEIPGILADHGIFLFTSIYEEPIARSVMEAMAAGLAVIGTPVGGQSEMLTNGVTALTFPPDDAAQLAACILQIRNDPVLRTRLAEAGQEMVLERFTLDRMVNEIEIFLETLITDSQHPKTQISDK